MTVRVTAHSDADNSESVVSSMECTICAYYSTTSDVPGSVLQTMRLPLSLAYEVHSAPCTDFNWSAKIVVDENPVALKTMFNGRSRGKKHAQLYHVVWVPDVDEFFIRSFVVEFFDTRISDHMNSRLQRARTL